LSNRPPLSLPSSLPDDVYYEPKNFAELGLRIATPPPEWGWDRPDEEIHAERMERYEAIKNEDMGVEEVPKIKEVRTNQRRKYVSLT
jgi:hypothetical protein